MSGTRPVIHSTDKSRRDEIILNFVTGRSASRRLGGLINLRQMPDDSLSVEISRIDPGVTVAVSPDSPDRDPYSGMGGRDRRFRQG